MRVAINLEFTDDELRNYAGDVGRRWIAHAIDEGIKGGKRLKINPDLMGQIVQALALTISSKLPSVPSPTAGTPEESDVREYGPVKRDRCDPVSRGPHLDDGWICHKCTTYNGNQRATCRHCDHERCDVIVTPPPIDPSMQ